MYFDKEAIVEVVDVVFEGETTQEFEPVDFSNPMVANEGATSAPETLEKTNSDVPEINPETAPMPPDASQPSILPKPC